MKKFITMIPLQPVNDLHKTKYATADNSRLEYEYYGQDESSYISFPILTALSGYAEKGETVQVIAVRQDYRNAEENYVRLQEEVKRFEKLRGCTCDIVEIVVSYSEYIDDHILAFEKIISHIEEGDELYACITFASKPSTMIEMYAISYAQKAFKNVEIKCIVYGHFDHETKVSTVYDMTRLCIIDEIYRSVAELKPNNPLDYVKSVLHS